MHKFTVASPVLTPLAISSSLNFASGVGSTSQVSSLRHHCIKKNYAAKHILKSNNMRFFEWNFFFWWVLKKIISFQHLLDAKRLYSALHLMSALGKNGDKKNNIMLCFYAKMASTNKNARKCNIKKSALKLQKQLNCFVVSNCRLDFRWFVCFFLPSHRCWH